MSEALSLSQERTQLFTDIMDGKIPKRVPVASNFAHEFAIQYAGKDLKEVQWDTTDLEASFEKVCEDFYSDLLSVSAFRMPSFYRILGSRNFVMGSNGFLQHPEVEGLKLEDYDAFIASPYNCILERVLPNLYPELNSDPVTRSLVMAKAFKAYTDETNNLFRIYGNLIDKFNYGAVTLFAAFCEAPFDILTDQLRGFKNITLDVRRIPDKVEAAVNAAIPLMIKMGTQVFPNKYNATFIPLHMAPYLRTKDFERLYWPGFKKLVEGLAEKGMRSYLFVEQDWMRYLDYLAELPAGTVMTFEYGDPKTVKDKLGSKHVISGFYPLTLLKTGTKQECIDKAKELIEILAPGGNYFFSFDKAIITLDSVNVDNTKAVLDYVANNASY
ncbi:uroporphyrinogen decarboxylase family protein [Desulfosporosinus sp. PR]|uniref:uroporphyrinogen decarboxylase family protein n=1 Tax=Candidatus Desulfosporosinus nitrosoreducens TaxID=3401928 RepID=UPI0027FAED59|nr:uroporphyrinogen decarboxylase family protein [Desulfosporosinus sp. PR]MDQ7092049.1 uroporphyrinogen decarboxylase family protein [Desulfosporosinus sp. PR]